MIIDILTGYFTSFMIASGILLAGLVLFLCKKLRSEKIKLNKLTKQKEYLKLSLQHNLKIAALAQFQALEVFPKLTKDEQKEIYQELLSSSKYSTNMIDMLLDIIKIEENNYFQSFNITNIQSTIENCVELNKSYSQDKNISFNINIDKQIGCIFTDKKTIQKLFSTLLETIEKRACKNSICTITVQKVKNKLVFEIEYYHSTKSKNENIEILNENNKYSNVGHGIKIQFCKKILELFNSTLEARSNKETCTISFSIDIKENKVFVPQKQNQRQLIKSR